MNLVYLFQFRYRLNFLNCFYCNFGLKFCAKFSSCFFHLTEILKLLNSCPVFLDHYKISHVVNASTNTTVAEYSYDAWGRMRNVSTWVNYAPGSEPALMIAGRGFTGHEHLPWFNLINMNGRVYDPLTGQFLSADNFVQAPDLTQGFNRYAYAFNNPLAITDPSGEIAIVDDIIVCALMYAAINTIIQGASGNIETTGDFFKAMGIGALTGAASAGAGALTQAIQIYGAIPGAITEGTITGTASGLAGGLGNVIME